MAYEHKNKKGVKYFLHSKEVKLRGSGKKQRIFYFAGKAGRDAIDEVPEGYQVIESKRTSLPLLKKK